MDRRACCLAEEFMGFARDEGTVGWCRGVGERHGWGRSDRVSQVSSHWSHSPQLRADAAARSYYTLIPASTNHPQPRTFCILPASTHPLFPCWRPSQSAVPEDEVAAHIGMFNPVTNEAFYEIGLDVCASVIEAVAFARGRDRA